MYCLLGVMTKNRVRVSNTNHLEGYKIGKAAYDADGEREARHGAYSIQSQFLATGSAAPTANVVARHDNFLTNFIEIATNIFEVRVIVTTNTKTKSNID